jgi:hypothetical protein
MDDVPSIVMSRRKISATISAAPFWRERILEVSMVI